VIHDLDFGLVTTVPATSGQPSPSKERGAVTADLHADGTVRVITHSDPNKLNAIGNNFGRGWIGT